VPTLICHLDSVVFPDAPQRRIDAWRAANGGVLGVATPADLADGELLAFRSGLLPEPAYARHLRSRLGWTGSEDELIRLWAAGSSIVLDVIDALSGLRERDWQLIATDDSDPWTQRARAAEFGWVLSVFERVIRAQDVTTRRPDPRYFAELVRILPRHGPRLYVDDDPRHVSAARRAGLDGHLFSGAADLKAACRSVLLAST
jgi:phosphoglycolate phosphatase-like HAD superfamily hydrolase